MADKTAYYVRYWETKQDYIVWTNDEIEYFDNNKQAQKFIKNCLLVDDAPVFAYELGMADKITEEGCDDVYENHESFDFYNADEIKKTATVIVSCTKKGVPEFVQYDIECTLNDVNTNNHLNMAIDLAKEDNFIEGTSFIAFDKESIEQFLSKKNKLKKL